MRKIYNLLQAFRIKIEICVIFHKSKKVTCSILEKKTILF